MRPVTKIGLIAPFEGLHRDTGYRALAAMRAAIAEAPSQANLTFGPTLDLLPLALDDSGEPNGTQRATEKLLVDSTVAAVIGPFAPDSLAQMERGMPQERSVIWLAPFLINPQGLHWSEITPADLVVVDAQGRKVAGKHSVEPTAFFQVTVESCWWLPDGLFKSILQREE